MSDFDSFSEVLDPIIEVFEDVANGFNNISFFILRLGNFILFLLYLGFGVNLLRSAKINEHDERIHGVNLEFIKRRGRIATVVYILIGLGFLFRLLTFLLFECFRSPLPLLFLIFLNKEDL